jgi:hypothetical protein
MLGLTKWKEQSIIWGIERIWISTVVYDGRRNDSAYKLEQATKQEHPGII